MKIVATFLIIFLSQITLASETGPIQFDQDALTQKLESFKSLVERNIVWRGKTAEVIKNLKQSIAEDKPFRAKDIRRLSEYTIPEYSIIQNQLKELITSTLWMADKKTILEFTEDETHFERKCKRGTFLCGVIGKKHLYAKLNPYDELGTFYFLHGLNSLAASSLLTDNYLLAFSQLQSNAKIREIIRYDIPDFEGFLKRLNNDFTEMNNYVAFTKSSEVFEKFKKYYKLEFRQKLFETKEFSYLFAILQKSYSLQEISKDGSYDQYKQSTTTVQNRFYKDRLKKLRDDSAYQLSRAFGNTAGSMRSRDGKLLDLTSEQVNEIKNTLRPLDMLFEKTPFILTDKLIPGHFGHVGIWIGTKQELIDLNLWNHPLITPHHASIEEGKGIVEALRPGVQINTVENFLNIDDLAIIRPHETLERDQIREGILRAVQQIGKEYDFNFDVETRRRLVCSELVYMVYEEIDWETDRTLGRFTISPEHVAKKVGDNDYLNTVLLYHDGKRYREELNEIIRILLEEKYEEIPTQKMHILSLN